MDPASANVSGLKDGVALESMPPPLPSKVAKFSFWSKKIRYVRKCMEKQFSPFFHLKFMRKKIGRKISFALIYIHIFQNILSKWKKKFSKICFSYILGVGGLCVPFSRTGPEDEEFQCYQHDLFVYGFLTGKPDSTYCTGTTAFSFCQKQNPTEDVLSRA